MRNTNGIYKRILATTRGSIGTYSDFYNNEDRYKRFEGESQDFVSINK